MGSYLGLANVILANVIMTELEQKVVKQLIDDKTLMLCGRYVDDTSVVIKPEDLNRVRNALNNFHLNLKFTRDTFNDIVPHFSDMEIHPSRLGIQYKPWHYKTAWIANIIHRATVICDERKILPELNRIKAERSLLRN